MAPLPYRDIGPLARVMRSLRAEHGLSQLQLALAAGAGDATYLSRLENGRRSNPSRLFLRRYVLAYSLLGHPLSEIQSARLWAAAMDLSVAA